MRIHSSHTFKLLLVVLMTVAIGCASKKGKEGPENKKKEDPAAEAAEQAEKKKKKEDEALKAAMNKMLQNMNNQNLPAEDAPVSLILDADGRPVARQPVSLMNFNPREMAVPTSEKMLSKHQPAADRSLSSTPAKNANHVEKPIGSRPVVE